MRTRKLWFVVVLILCLGAGIAWKYFLPDMEQIPKNLKDVSVDLSLEGVTLRQGKEGHLLWTLNATSAEYQKDEGFVLLQNPKILYFQEDKPDPLYVQGDHGTIDQKRDVADIWSNVIARYQGMLLTTDRLQYDGTKRLLEFKQNVVMEREDMRITADAAEVHLKGEHLRAYGNVHTQINGAPSP